MQYVLGIDLGTSAVKVSAVDKTGKVACQATRSYPLSEPKPGYSEQEPSDWVKGTKEAIKELLTQIKAEDIKGISLSGQMHGLVLLDDKLQVLRPAILWNDTRTSRQCQEILDKMGEKFIEITGNTALEGFTLPKILWVKEHEPEIWAKTKLFLLPKDYVRLAMTGKAATDYSDATGTVMLDIQQGIWSKEILDNFDIPESVCPPLLDSIDLVGQVNEEFAKETGLVTTTKVFAGGGDNACGAVGAGILQAGIGMSSIGTSGVVLRFEDDPQANYDGKLQMEDHAAPGSKYSMGVTLAAGFSLSWFKKQFYPQESFDKLTEEAAKSPVGANGLLFAPYLMGERTPYADPKIRGSFIGISGDQTRSDFARSVMEGITYSFKDIFEIYRQAGKTIKKVVAIGGGAKSDLWLQMQADIFSVPVLSLSNDRGCHAGCNRLRLVQRSRGVLQDFCSLGHVYEPDLVNAKRYEQYYQLYRQLYPATKEICASLTDLRACQLF